MTTESLATVDRLSARLGITLTADTPDYARAEEALWSASVQARAAAQRPEWTAENLPDSVLDIVLAAALRVYKNPDRFLTNQAGAFQTGVSATDFSTGSMFLAGELATLSRYRPGVVDVVTTYRDDDSVFDPRADPANYTPAPIDGIFGDQLYGWSGQFDH